MNVAMIPSQFSMEPTMPTIVAVTEPIVEALLPFVIQGIAMTLR